MCCSYDWKNRLPSFGRIPCISIAVNGTGSMTIEVNPLARQDESRLMVLELNWVRVVAPVV